MERAKSLLAESGRLAEAARRKLRRETEGL